MSDNPTQQILEILARLEAGQASFAAGQVSLEARLTSLEAGQASLEAGQASLGIAQTLLGTAQTSLRVDLMARMDRLQDGITAIRDDIAVNIGAVEAGRRANDNTRDDLRTLNEQVSVMWKQLKRLQTDMREIRGIRKSVLVSHVKPTDSGGKTNHSQTWTVRNAPTGSRRHPVA